MQEKLVYEDATSTIHELPNGRFRLRIQMSEEMVAKFDRARTLASFKFGRKLTDDETLHYLFRYYVDFYEREGSPECTPNIRTSRVLKRGASSRRS